MTVFENSHTTPARQTQAGLQPREMSVNGSQTTSSSTQQYGLSTGTASPQSSSTAPPILRLPVSRLARLAARQPDASVNSFSGAVAGIASGIVTCPLDVIKTKLQGQAAFRPRGAPLPTAAGRPSYQGMFGTASIIWQQDGIRGMYRGLGPMILGYLPTWAVYMSVYGASRDYYYSRIGACPPLPPRLTFSARG